MHGSTVVGGLTYTWQLGLDDDCVITCGRRRYVCIYEDGVLHDHIGRLDDAAADAIAADVKAACDKAA